MKNVLKISLAAVFFTAAISCSQVDGIDSLEMEELEILTDEAAINARISTNGIEPILWTSGPGGNATCADTGLDFGESTSRNDFNNGKFENEWPEGLSIEVVNGKFVNWSFDAPEGQCLETIAFIVKGGPASHIYIYDNGEVSDEGLVSPLVGNKKKQNYADLSNLTVCFSLNEECGGNDDDEEEES